MILNESKRSYFSTSSTGIDKYDDMLRDPEFAKDKLNVTYSIKMMEPIQYISMCAKHVFNVSTEKLYIDRDDNKISNMISKMKSGVVFDMPVIDFTNHTQDGLHRAISLMDIDNTALMPVMIVYHNKPLSKFIPTK